MKGQPVEETLRSCGEDVDCRTDCLQSDVGCVLTHHSRLLGILEFVTKPEIGTSPIRIVLTEPNISMKRRPWPVFHTFNQTMFQRIDVDVIDAPFQV